MYNIIGYYQNWILFERNGFYYIARRREKLLFKGTEEEATKIFTLLIAGFINEEEL